MASSLCYNFLRRSALCRHTSYAFMNFASKKSTRLEENVNPRTTGSGVDDQILSAGSPGSVFDQINEKMTVNQVSNAITMLSKWKTDNILTSEQIIKNKKFSYLCQVLEDNFHQVNAGTLLFTLKNLLNIGVSADEHVVQTLENQVLWILGKMTFKNLVNLLSFHVQFQESPLQKRVVFEAVRRIQLRWFEMDRPRDIIQLFKCISYFPDEFIDKLEDKAVEIAEKMSAEEASKLIGVMAEKGRRPTPLLRAMAFYIAKHQQQLPLKQIVNLLHSLSALKFPDEVLMERLSTDLLPQIAVIKNPATVSVILTAFGKLRWRHIDLLEAAADWMQKNVETCRLQEIVALILSLAKLNFLPRNADSLFKLLVPKLTQDAIPSDATWLDVVWSLVVLRQATANHVSSVLKPELYKKLLGLPTFGHKLKILNINAYAEQELEGYKGPFLPKEPLLDNIVIPRNTEEQALCASVVNTLSNFIPAGKFLLPGRMTSSGIYIDAEFKIGKDGKPLALIEDTVSENYSEASKRIALIVTHYKDVCRHSQEVSGIIMLSVRLLTAAGYTVLQVRHTDYDIHAATLKRVQYLQGLIAEISGK